MKSIFKEEKRSTLVEQVATQLREAIKSGKLVPGDRLIETNIADAMKTGRNAVREAIRYLEKEGLVTTTPFKGAHVTIPTADDIHQIHEAMAGLAGLCAGLAVKKITSRELEKLEVLHAEIEKQYAKKDEKAYLDATGTFHLMIQELAKNESLNKVVTEFRQRALLFNERQLGQPNRFEASIKEHRKIMAAFKKKDAELVEKVTKKHYLKMGQVVLKSYQAKEPR